MATKQATKTSIEENAPSPDLAVALSELYGEPCTDTLDEIAVDPVDGGKSEPYGEPSSALGQQPGAPVSKRQFYRRVIQYEILSEAPIPAELSLADIDSETDTGDWVGMFLDDAANEVVDGKRMAELLTASSSQPGFFQLDEYGADVDQ